MADTYVAYCLDEAVAYLGNWIIGEIEKTTEDKEQRKAKRKAEGKLKLMLGMLPGKDDHAPTTPDNSFQNPRDLWEQRKRLPSKGTTDFNPDKP